ncbi:CCA tRNA nucleotidyltransferase [Nanoarchaeota archaeon]
MKLLQKVLKNIKPTKEEEKKIKNKIDGFLKKLNSVAGDAKLFLGGSAAKGTWLKGSHDADIFVLFDFRKYFKKSHKLADILEERLKKKFSNYERLHGSRDYFQIKSEGFVFEIVPILRIAEAQKAVNITDVSPLHAKWVKKAGEGIKDDIRLVKAFCKAQGLYGAESYIRGFSGYVLEILVEKYGGFIPLLEASLHWHEKCVIDVERYYQSREAAIVSLNEAKVHSPIIVIDPVDKSRNAAAALNREKFLLFREKAGDFLKKPAENFFVKEKISLANLKKKKGNLVYLEVESLKGKKDIVGAKLLKVFVFLRKRLKEFSVLESGWDWDEEKKAVFWYLVKEKEIDKYELRWGPPISLKKRVRDFKKVHKKTFEDKNRVCAKVARKYTKLKDYIKNVIKDEYVKERVKKIV